MEELDDLPRQRGAAREAGTQASAEPLLHLRVDEPVGEAMLEGEPGRDRTSALAQLADTSADTERPVDQTSLDARLLGERRRDGGVDLLVDTRHAREDGRPHL